MPDHPTRPKPYVLNFAAAYLLLSGLLLALYWFPEAKQLAGDEHYYHHTALALLAGGDWFDGNLIWPPLQALILAGIYGLAGPSVLAVQLLQLLMLAGGGLLLADIWRRLGGSREAAAWAAALLCINPLTVGFATYLWPEIPHLVLCLLLAWCLLRSREAGTPGVCWAAGAGAALGLCLLAKSLLTGFWPLLLLPLWQRGRRNGNLLRIVAFLAATLLVTAPALYRGMQVTGKPQIADSSWFNLWVGLGDRWRNDFVFDETGQRMHEYLTHSPDPRARNAFAREQAEAIVAGQGLVGTFTAQLGKQYFRLFSARHFVVSQLHGRICDGYTSRYGSESFVVNRGGAWLMQAWHVALLAMAAFGLAAWRQWRQPWLWLAAAFVAYQMALFFGLHVKSRFLVPMLPLLCLFAGHWLAMPRRERRPRAAGWLLAGLLAFLALAGPWLDDACDQAGRSGSEGLAAGATGIRNACATSV
ncbi:glycosyltransferase family 39 protein [Pseudofulvimonas gallinarii]|uniref:Dolichyl-phosphate-mannose-protein mannosyltransferase n=1 Tax=Pseudofulvimonas gallinarii TaxID=634155 RepID=A0A4R3LER3_9GAMM|nr:glycosyltransferase family 39 protein [Pseudofulvimonas gallinarii]TCS98489.1 dolichyl-phosphate-mannose-protein mannosyltransferase [Pseudofulvimonas gallinarii]